MALVADDALLLGILGTFRKTLGACPEGSGEELRTSFEVKTFLSSYAPDALIDQLGGHGVCAIFDGGVPGPTVMIRAELDAIPVEEGRRAYAHKCGHDGHMAMVAGLAALFARTRPQAGRVALLFQPAEETGQGAPAVIEDPRFENLAPDMAVAVHNLPGWTADAVVVRDDVFASASVGMRIHLIGEASHAAEPDKGRPPGPALARLLQELPRLSALEADDQRLLTLTHTTMGKPSFGVSPGHAELCATLRAKTLVALRELKNEALHIAKEVATADGLDVDVEWVEEFPETRNEARLVSMLRSTATDLGLHVEEAARPFRWSDDFGHFAAVIPSVYFGLGIGPDAPRLHQLDYTFPERTVAVGLALLHQLTLRLLGSDEGAHLEAV